MGNRSKDATLFALQERVDEGYGWRNIEVRQKKAQLPAPVGRHQRIKRIRNRRGKWL